MNNVYKFVAKAIISFAIISGANNALQGQSTITRDSGTSAAPTTNIQTVNAVQSGLWTVGIDAAKNTVRLANSESDPLPVKITSNGPTRSPFQSRVVVTVPAGYGVGSTTLPIPVGKRMVIENLSAVARVPQGLHPFMQFLTFFNNGDTVLDARDIAYHRIALVEQGNFYGQITSTANHKVLVFSDERVAGNANLGVTVSFGISGTVTQAATAEVTFSGYFEDASTTP